MNVLLLCCAYSKRAVFAYGMGLMWAFTAPSASLCAPDINLMHQVPEMKHQPAQLIEPLPVFQTSSDFNYPEKDRRPSPFELRRRPRVSHSVRSHRLKKVKVRHSVLFPIRYAKALDIAAMIQDQNHAMLSKQGVIRVDGRTNTIWLQDTDLYLARIRRFIHQLDVPVKQVLIEARIVNMVKQGAEDLGLRFGVTVPAHGVSGTLVGAQELAHGVSDVPVSERLNVDLGALPMDVSPASIGIALAKLGHGVMLDLELSALESEGRAEIIARPRLMTTNQQPATIESGEDIPYQESTLSGATAVAFKKAVLSLKVIPQITSGNRLIMTLQINQDADSGRRVQGVPVILTKSIDTNVLVNNGETIVLGGIYKQDKHHRVTRVPFLGKLPWVGVLFRRIQVQTKQEELLIFITPRIIVSENSSAQGRHDR